MTPVSKPKSKPPVAAMMAISKTLGFMRIAIVCLIV
jgi:hypothetical protein